MLKGNGKHLVEFDFQFSCTVNNLNSVNQPLLTMFSRHFGEMSNPPKKKMKKNEIKYEKWWFATSGCFVVVVQFFYNFNLFLVHIFFGKLIEC